ncbi:MAG: hypothetical protein QW374_04575 [Candidatus Bathyarchaeia archaeon]|nr:hypothetical protein [Candidatus Bathyarchaeota archaeon]
MAYVGGYISYGINYRFTHSYRSILKVGRDTVYNVNMFKNDRYYRLYIVEDENQDCFTHIFKEAMP